MSTAISASTSVQKQAKTHQPQIKKAKPEAPITPIVMNTLLWGLYALNIIHKPDPLNYAVLALTEFAANKSTVEVAKKIQGKVPLTPNRNFVTQLAGNSMGAAALITSICAANHFGFEVSPVTTNTLLYISSLRIAGTIIPKLLGCTHETPYRSLISIPLFFSAAPILNGLTMNGLDQLKLRISDQCWDVSGLALDQANNMLSTAWSIVKWSAIISGVTIAASALEVKISSMLSKNNDSKILTRMEAHPRLKTRIEAYLDIADTTPLKDNTNDLKTLVRAQVLTRLKENLDAILDIADNTDKLINADRAEDQAIAEVSKLETELLSEWTSLGLVQKTHQFAA